MSGKSAMCWWHSVTSVPLKSARRMQLLLSHLTIYGAWAKTSQKWIHHGFIPKWAITDSSQKPRNSQRLSLASGEMCFFPIICQDLKMVHDLKIQLEPSLLLDRGVTAGGSSFPNEVTVHVADYHEAEVRVEESSPCVGQVNMVTTFTFNSRHRFLYTFGWSPHCRKKPQELQAHLAS